MVMKFMEGDVAGAAKIQIDAIPLINALFCEVNPIPVKEAMNQMGLPSGPCRMPLCDMTDAHKEALHQTLLAYGLIH